ncbi:MAG: L,D-transpeptidase [Maribacter sp.]|nr:L,D-transpeptidase [Maribacter sp.]
MSKRLLYTLSFLLLLLISITLAKLLESNKEASTKNTLPDRVMVAKNHSISRYILVQDTVPIKNYFDYMDSLVTAYDSLTQYPLSEHILVNFNSWIIDTLANTDYYRMAARDSFVYDQREMIVLKPKDSLFIPDSLEAYSIIDAFGKTRIDINLPEYKLRIFKDSIVTAIYSIRIGQNKHKYLKMGEKLTDLRTKTGNGHIIRFRKNPAFYNPTTGKQFFVTRRDDNKTTLMPQIPWIVTEISGLRNGQLIHPTTNPKSLGKASSNGCIGVKESDAWRIYYDCPIGTDLHIRYDLKIVNDLGTELLLKDIYKQDI